MSAIATPSVRPSVPVEYTPEDLLQIQEQGLFELVDGRLLEKPMSFLANETAGRITRLLGNFLDTRPSKGSVLPEQSFQCFAKKPRQIRRPDVAVIVADRVPAVRPLGHVKITPDIAIEVLSPNDNVYELDFKLDDYRLAAIPLVWVVNPITRAIRVYRPGKPIDELRDGDTLSADAILPDFSVSITDLLLPVEVTSEVPEAKEE